MLACARPAAAGDDAERFAAGELIVRYETGVDRGDQAALREGLGATLLERVLPRAEVVGLGPEASVLDAVRAFEQRPEVHYAEPNYLLELDTFPNDPLLFEQAWLHDTGQTFGDLDGVPPSFMGAYDADVDAPEAWAINTGSPSVTIGIADTGIDSSHPDLAANIVPGFDFAGDNSGGDDPDPSPDGSDHGTHVAGIAGAIGNNGTGVAGVGWHSTLMPLKVRRPDGRITAGDLAQAFSYAAANGVQVVNASLGGPDMSALLRNAIDYAPGTLFVVSAGNDGINLDDPLDLNPQRQQFPCEHSAPNIICVTSTNHNDELAGFSNFGPASVDLAAPGVSILSTTLTYVDQYAGPFGFKTGTSMSTPMVSGTAALLFALETARTHARALGDVSSAILGSVDPLPSLAGITVSGGRLNVGRAVGAAGELPVDTTIVSGPKQRGRSRHVAFSFNSPTHRPASFLCQMDSKGFQPCAAVATYRVGRARHIFTVKAIDVIGREDPTPAQYPFRVKKKKKKKGK